MEGFAEVVNDLDSVLEHPVFRETELASLVTYQPFPSMASIDVAIRCSMRAMAGFSQVEPLDRFNGQYWPSSEADHAILGCLEILIVCATTAHFQDDRLIERLKSLRPFRDSSWIPRYKSQRDVLSAIAKLSLFVSAFFENGAESQADRSNFLQILMHSHDSDPHGNSAHRIEMDDHSASMGPNAVLLSQPIYSAWADRDEISDSDEIQARIWPWESQETVSALEARGEYYRFWSDWIRSWIAGEPLDWELQRRVALIPDQDWGLGPEHIAKIIDDIRNRYDIETAATAVENQLVQDTPAQVIAVNPMIGHNQPPEGEQLPLAPQQFESLLATVQSVQVQMQSGDVDWQSLRRSADEIETAQKTIGAWLAEKLDKSADEFFKEFGKWGGRVAIAGLTGTALWFFGLFEKLTPLLGLLRQLVGL